MKITKKNSIVRVAAISMAVSMIANLGITAYAETDANVLTTTAVATSVDLSQVARKTTTIDVTIPEYQMVATPTYTWNGTFTTHATNPAIVLTDCEGEFVGATMTVKGVDGTVLTYAFTANDPDAEDFDNAIWSQNKKTVTIALDFAKLGGKLSAISSVYDNTRAGDATDTLYGETKLDTPAIASVSVTAKFQKSDADTWKKAEITEFTNDIKATKAALTGVHAYTVKSETEDGTRYNNIFVKGAGASDISAADAFKNDAKNFKSEIAPLVKSTENAFPVDPNKTAEEVWDDYAAKTGIGSAGVPADYVEVTVSEITELTTNGATTATYTNSIDALKPAVTTPGGTANNVASAPAGINYAGITAANIEPLIQTHFGADKSATLQLFTDVTKGTNFEDDTVTFYLGVTAGSGAETTWSLYSYKGKIEELTGNIILTGMGTNVSVPGSSSKTTVSTSGKQFTLPVNALADLKAALHAGTVGSDSTGVWNDAAIGVSIGAYKGTVGTLTTNVTNKLPAGIDYSAIDETLIGTINKSYGLKTDSNAVVAFKPVVSGANADTVTFYASVTQKGTRVTADSILVFKSADMSINTLANGELVLNGVGANTSGSTAAANGAAIRLAIDDAATLKAALTKDNMTPWDGTNYVTLGNYTAGVAAVEPDVDDVTTALAAAGYSKPAKATYSYKTAETKARTLAVPYYTKGDNAFNSKADFITTYNAVLNCYENLTEVQDAALQGDATDMTVYGPLSNFGPTANLYSAGKSTCTTKAAYEAPDPIAPSGFGGATTAFEKENRIFGIYNDETGNWEPVWTNITGWNDYYNTAYNNTDSTSYYHPGVLAEINDIIGTNKGAIVSIHVDPEGFEEDGRTSEAKRWFELNGRCVLRVNGSSSAIYSNLVTYDAATSTFSFNWDDITQNRYNDSTILVRTLEIMTSEKLEVDSITVSIPDQTAYNELLNPKPVEPEDDDKVVNVGDNDGDTVIEIEDGDKTENDNIEIEAPDDEDTPPEDLDDGNDSEKEDNSSEKEPEKVEDNEDDKDNVNDIPSDLDTTVTQKPVVDVEATVPEKDTTPSTGEPIAVASVATLLAGVAGFLKKKLG